MKGTSLVRWAVLWIMLANIIHAANFGSAGYSSGPDGWYEITTNSYPLATPFSTDRNVGTSSGSVYLSPTGLIIGEAGDYRVDISAILQNTAESDLIIPVFLAVEKPGDPITTEIDPSNPNPIGDAVIVSGDTFFVNLSGTGFLKNVMPGTRLSLVATNGGYPEPKPITVVSWGISAQKID